MPGIDETGDLVGQVIPDIGELGQVGAFLQHVGEAAAEVADRARRVAVGAHPERVGLLDFQQVGDMVERIRDLDVVHGHGQTSPL